MSSLRQVPRYRFHNETLNEVPDFKLYIEDACCQETKAWALWPRAAADPAGAEFPGGPAGRRPLRALQSDGGVRLLLPARRLSPWSVPDTTARAVSSSGQLHGPGLRGQCRPPRAAEPR